MSRIKELLVSIEEADQMASQELLSFPFSIRSGMEGQIRAAQEALPKLESEYITEVVKNCVIIPVAGKQAEFFAKVAQEEFGVLGINYYQAADETAQAVINRRYDDYYSSNTYSASLDQIYQLKAKYKISKLPYMEAIGAEYYGKSLFEAFRAQFTQAYGSELYSAVIRHVIGHYAIKNGYDGTKMPVIMYNYNENLGVSENFLPNPVPFFNLSDSKKITKDTVSEMLTKLKNKLTNKTETTIEE